MAQDAKPEDEYRIGGGDLLNVEVVGRPDLSGQYPVGLNGFLFVPMAGSLKAEGKTAADLASDLSRRLSLFDRAVTVVHVSIAEYRSQRIFVLGAVLRPGKYAFAGFPTVWEAIGEAGGPADDAELSRVEIIRGDAQAGGSGTFVDVSAAIRDGTMKSLGRLRPGDTVRVPRVLGTTAPAVNSIYVLGGVAIQQSLPLEQATDLLTAVLRSGGPTADADLSKVKIVRKNGKKVVTFRANLADYLDRADLAGNPLLEPGDTVYLPRTPGGGRGVLATLRMITPFVALATAVTALVDRR